MRGNLMPFCPDDTIGKTEPFLIAYKYPSIGAAALGDAALTIDELVRRLEVAELYGIEVASVDGLIQPLFISCCDMMAIVWGRIGYLRVYDIMYTIVWIPMYGMMCRGCGAIH